MILQGNATRTIRAHRFSTQAWAVGFTLSVLFLSGCSYSPSINIMGSYFPAWMICCAVAIGLTVAAHSLFAKWRILGELWPLPLLYTSLISFVSCTLWIIFFR